MHIAEKHKNENKIKQNGKEIKERGRMSEKESENRRRKRIKKILRFNE